MRVIWRRQARSDIRTVVSYLLDRDPNAAVRVQAAIEQQTELLAEHPNLGRSGRAAGTRELVITRTPYIVAYTIDLQIDAVVILRVLHGAQLWPDTL